METITLNAETRTQLGKKAKLLKAVGQIPAVLYGHEATNQNITLELKSFTKLFNHYGSSSLIDLIIDNKAPVKILIHDTQIDPMTGNLLHADLFQVKLDEKIQTEINLSFIGESAAVKDLEGNLVTTKDSVKVEAFPQDLVSEIEVDLALLATFDDKITVADLTIPKGVEILDDVEETIAVVTPPRSDEELEAELAETSADDEAAAVAATAEASTTKPEGEEEEGAEAEKSDK